MSQLPVTVNVKKMYNKFTSERMSEFALEQD